MNDLDYQISLAKHYARPYIACTISLSILLVISLAGNIYQAMMPTTITLETSQIETIETTATQNVR